MSETELLRAFTKERSEEAFTELVRRYAGLVYSVAKRRLASAALAEDITQLVFIRFAKSPPDVDTPGELAAWLHRMTVNVTIDTWRSETRRRNREELAAAMEPATTTDTHAVWEEMSPNLDEAINQLNDDDRQAILLRFFKSKTMRDVGTALGVSEAAAKMRVGRAVDKLRTQLGASAGACTAVALGGVLAERSVEAAPVQLVSRLAAMKLPAAAGAAGKGAVLHSISRISGVKLAAGAAGLALVAISVMHFARSSVVPQTMAQTSSNVAGAPARNAQPTEPAEASLPAAAPTKPVKFHFHVLDAETGAGLAQTKIRFIYFGAGGGEGHDTMTDDKGDAAITEPDDPAMRAGPNVFAAAEGHVPKAVTFTNAPPPDFTIRLDPAATASGVIVDEDGLAVPGVKLFVRETPGMKPGQIETVDFQLWPVTSREDGNWTCSYIPRHCTNSLGLTLSKPGYAETDLSVPVNLLGLNNLTLVINSGYTIAGKITDQESHPIASARIKVLDSGSRKPQSTRSDENGDFTLTGARGDIAMGVLPHNLPPMETNDNGVVMIRGGSDEGPFHAYVVVQAEGFAPQMKTVALSAATNSADFALATGNIFKGRVVDEAGNPISNAVAETDDDLDHQIDKNLDWNLIDRMFDWKARTDANGWFEWDSAPAEEISYGFEADGYVPARNRILAADGSEHQIVLKSDGAKPGE